MLVVENEQLFWSFLLPGFYVLIFKKTIINWNKGGRVTEKGGERESQGEINFPSIMIKAGPGRSHEPRTLFRTPVWLAGSWVAELPKTHSYRKLDCKCCSQNSDWYLIRDAGVPSGSMLVLNHNASFPHFLIINFKSAIYVHFRKSITQYFKPYK